MKVMKHVLAFTCIGAMMMSLAGCGNSSSDNTTAAVQTEAGTTAAAQAEAGTTTAAQSEAAASDAKVKIGFTAMNLTDPFQITVRDTVKELAEAEGWEFQSGDGNSDNAKQINLVEDMINAGITHLVLCPVSQDGILPVLQACKEAGVKVVNYDSAVTDRDLVECYIASDNYSAGKMDAEYLNEHYPEGGELMIINNPKAESVVARVKGLTENLNENFVIVEDAAIQSSKDVLSKVDDALQVHPDLKFIFGLNDTCGMIALGSCQSAGRDDIVVVSVDGSPDCQASIKDGGMTATAAQSPVTLGVESFNAIKKLVAGEPVEDIAVPCFIISKDNIDEYDITQWH